MIICIAPVLSYNLGTAVLKLETQKKSILDASFNYQTKIPKQKKCLMCAIYSFIYHIMKIHQYHRQYNLVPVTVTNNISS